MNVYFKHRAACSQQADARKHSVFDQRSSERLVRDEVVVRAPRDPDAALMEAIKKNAEEAVLNELEEA